MRRAVIEGVRPRAALAVGLAALAIAVALSTAVTPALACSCAVVASPASPTANYEVSFLGRVTNIGPSPCDFGLTRVGFVTIEGYQFGQGTRSVVTPASEAACGYPFVVGTTYEVRAHPNADGALVTDACSGTQPSNRSLPHVGYPTDPMPQRPGDLAILIGVAVIVAVTTSGIVLIQRLLRR